MLKEITEKEYEQYRGSSLVLADFFSSTCGPCKMLSYVLKDIEAQYGDSLIILKVDFDENKELVEEFQVTAYPTLILLKEGKEVERMQGLAAKPAIIKMIEKYKEEK
ncbi:thioredoxin family protein [Murimonas intestini]|uniref:Thioredoxin n=1 Tax=Murimonas intestini TaxID=1337051 RepID=A0AB73T3D2_9FIRM|nr:thioredoxin domain-containing protein [Murimonas intestini]MCR1841134.1 thioredoxin domain-containing protein [Murimonas intestini]MCR1865749.1 thioredoxin domain-containing protein [Murimonas intestini]MCR1883169.1 thioredoxin domain-containing protein [Murimonas intestini]